MSVLSSSRLDWYVRRAARMSPAEVAWRARDQAVQLAWARRQVQPGQTTPAVPARPAGARSFAAVLPPQAADAVPAPAAEAVLKAADRLLRGEWEVLGVARTDLVQPDWFADPVTGRRAQADRYAFRINHRSQDQTGNIKQVWEISRLHHLTLLATAWYLSRDEAYAERVAAQLRSWWQDNPFLSGVHWTSGIEIGIRLISFAWIRRLLDDWPPVTALFEDSALAVAQIRWHQQYLAGFRSRGSSANNHVIAEAAGQLVAACAFPWYPESERWRRGAARLLEQELDHNTFPSGIGRELASGYQCFVAELGLVAAVEAQAAGHPLSAAAWQRLGAMTDSAAALLDQRLRPPRQGDGDDGCALVLDPPAANRWPSLLALGDALFGRLDWWPEVAPDAGSALIGALAGPPRDIAGRPPQRPDRFADAGITLLRTSAAHKPEIWCRCDGGPHGFLSIAAHAHADALSVELRYGGVDILADPGTYCYHGEPAWRSYFRSTIGHNTVEVGGQNQSAEGGPFLWLRHAQAREIEVLEGGETATWTAEHDGYLTLDPPSRHRRSVRLDRAARAIEITDHLDSDHDVRLAFHLGPEVNVDLDGPVALLSWPESTTPGAARMDLPAGLEWSVHQGETNPILGWYSEGLGRRVPTITLLGRGRTVSGQDFRMKLEFIQTDNREESVLTRSALSWATSDPSAQKLPSRPAEAG